jgi:hypothetical protein
MYQYVWFAIDLANERVRDADRQHLLHGDHLDKPSRVRRAIAKVFGTDDTSAGEARRLDGYATK